MMIQCETRDETVIAKAKELGVYDEMMKAKSRSLDSKKGGAVVATRTPDGTFHLFQRFAGFGNPADNGWMLWRTQDERCVGMLAAMVGASIDPVGSAPEVRTFTPNPV